MQTARLSQDWKITIPPNIRKKLNLKKGDKIVFDEGDTFFKIKNSSIAALEEIQKAFEGEAEKAGLFTEDDVLALCKEVRRELYEEQYAV